MSVSAMPGSHFEQELARDPGEAAAPERWRGNLFAYHDEDVAPGSFAEHAVGVGEERLVAAVLVGMP